jgi:mannosyltransferase
MNDAHCTARRTRRVPQPPVMRWLLVFLILASFTRLVYQLGAKELWVDESFSLQRAQSDWLTILRGTIVISDGLNSIPTTDQHPPAYFLFLALLQRLTGDSEFALRFPSAVASTLLVPVAWALARRLTRLGTLPPGSALCTAILVTLSPFHLWFGQEARPYEQMALFGLLSTYLLLRWANAPAGRSRRLWLLAYGGALFVLLGTHYFAVLILPVHAAVAYYHLAPQNPRRALLGTATVLGVSLVPIAVAFSTLWSQAGAGSNFVRISLPILVPDMLNAFSLGLSVNLGQVWPLDLVFAGLALFGLGYSLVSLRRGRSWGWVMPALLLFPPSLLLLINTFRPAFMNSRHVSVVSGVFLVLVAGGLAWVWGRAKVAGAVVSLVLLAGMLYSARNYYVLPEYSKGDMSSMGHYLRAELQPGDLLLLKPASARRLFQYYLPLDRLTVGESANARASYLGVPLLASPNGDPLPDVEALGGLYRRVWMADVQRADEVDQELGEHLYFVRESHFESPISELTLKLYLPSPPIGESLPVNVQHRLGVAFADHPGAVPQGGQTQSSEIRLLGYDVGQPLAPGSQVPVTLYWQAPAAVQRHYKYILSLVRANAGGELARTAVTEREPYDGALPTNQWPAGKTITEYTGVDSPATGLDGGYELTLQVYDAESLGKLPLVLEDGAQPGPDANTIILPLH